MPLPDLAWGDQPTDRDVMALVSWSDSSVLARVGMKWSDFIDTRHVRQDCNLTESLSARPSQLIEGDDLLKGNIFSCTYLQNLYCMHIVEFLVPANQHCRVRKCQSQYGMIILHGTYSAYSTSKSNIQFFWCVLEPHSTVSRFLCSLAWSFIFGPMSWSLSSSAFFLSSNRRHRKKNHWNHGGWNIFRSSHPSSDAIRSDGTSDSCLCVRQVAVLQHCSSSFTTSFTWCLRCHLQR